MDGPRPPPPNPSMPYREDCWSEGATSALIDAWGDRYLDLNRGNLRQKDWQDVADAVNSRRAAAHRPPRTDSQCKNRIDTLKKKYKTEKSRIIDSAGTISSLWPFFPRLDALIGSSPSAPKKTSSISPPLALPLPSHRKPSPLPAARPVAEPKLCHTPPTALPVSESFRRNYTAAAAAAAAAAADGDSMSSASSSHDRSRSPMQRRPMKRVRREDDEAGEDGVREVAKAIMRFTEIYEKVEREKQQQMMELEKQRMEFAKRMEFQRMQIFVDSQVQLEKIKRARREDGGEQGSSVDLSFLFQPALLNM